MPKKPATCVLRLPEDLADIFRMSQQSGETLGECIARWFDKRTEQIEELEKEIERLKAKE